MFQFSGIPVSHEDKEKYVEEINTKMGFSGSKLELKIEDFSSDPDLRQQFKVILNSMLGKLAQQSPQETSQFVTSQRELRELMKNHDITNVNIAANEFCHLSVQSKKPFDVNKKGNCVVYAFITARTRILMHQHLMALQKAKFSLYYTDCDSLIFVGEKTASLPLPIGFAFGDFKEELGFGTEIQSFSCTGRKQYRLAYTRKGNRNREEEVLFKIKGISLTSQLAKKRVLDQFPTPDVLAQDIEAKKKICIPQVRRVKNSFRKQMFHINVDSSCQRKCTNDQALCTLPWGYIK